jgi:Raf kinase inhibitor-like YbhB/YbcL family protein
MKPVQARLRPLASRTSSRTSICEAQRLFAQLVPITDAEKLKHGAQAWYSVVKLVVAIGLLSASISGSLIAAEKPARGEFQLHTTAFQAGGFIPPKYTCSGDNVSPALSWTGVPGGTKSLVLIVSDPDAPSGTWIHWIVYDLPASARQLPERLPKAGDIEGGGRQGTTSFQEVGYGGPCPPPGDAHHYHFTLYALNARLNLQAGASGEQIDGAMKGHVIAKAELIGLYKR